LAGVALLVVDEAYGEYAGVASAASLAQDAGNIVVLRTLSKAHALAGARIGCAIATPAVASALRRCQAPYPLPASCVALGLAALAPASVDATGRRVARVREQRDRLAAALAHLPGVRRVYPSQANFLLVRFDDAGAALQRLRADGIVVRDQRAAPQLGDALRISIGTPAQNRRVLAALGGAAA
jgi:histidinol-phosphate aminotransferase